MDHPDHCTEFEFVIVGGGITGLTAGGRLRSRCVVLERGSSVGGLVRTIHQDGFWFDLVPHFLHVHNERIRGFVGEILGDTLVPIRCSADIRVGSRTVPYPIQNHVGALGWSDASVVAGQMIVRRIRRVFASRARTYERLLEQTFGPRLCDLFFRPYNTKYWRRDLARIAPEEIRWNIATPTIAEILVGLFRQGRSSNAYNREGYFPRPPIGAPTRGMEVLSRRLAERVTEIRRDHEVIEIDPSRRRIMARTPSGVRMFGWTSRCLSTIPLPVLVSMISSTPESVRRAANSLDWNRARIAAIGVEGNRPPQPSWRYCPDASLPYYRLIFLNEFDPAMAPPGCWGVLAESTEPANTATTDDNYLQQVEAALRRTGVLGTGDKVRVRRLFTIDPAYVVFNRETKQSLSTIRAYLTSIGIDTAGRFGSWGYSSMSRDIETGLMWSDTHRAAFSDERDP
ncbi:MAG: protoporphyrinogen/coproporphyrinogen oxidase [Phycisphaerales bacterium JB043]